jgi:hypothetical protein
VGSDAAAVREYFSVWRHRNFLVNNTRAWRPGAVETDRHMVARDRLVRSDFFNEYMKHYDADRVLRLSLLTEAGVHQSISLSRHDSIPKPATRHRTRPAVDAAPAARRADRLAHTACRPSVLGYG